MGGAASQARGGTQLWVPRASCVLGTCRQHGLCGLCSTAARLGPTGPGDQPEDLEGLKPRPVRAHPGLSGQALVSFQGEPTFLAPLKDRGWSPGVRQHAGGSVWPFLSWVPVIVRLTGPENLHFWPAPGWCCGCSHVLSLPASPSPLLFSPAPALTLLLPSPAQKGSTSLQCIREWTHREKSCGFAKAAASVYRRGSEGAGEGRWGQWEAGVGHWQVGGPAQEAPSTPGLQDSTSWADVQSRPAVGRLDSEAGSASPGPLFPLLYEQRPFLLGASADGCWAAGLGEAWVQRDRLGGAPGTGSEGVGAGCTPAGVGVLP